MPTTRTPRPTRYAAAITVVAGLLASPGAAFAGGVKGIAVENLTGFPLTRTRVTLAKLEGNTFRTVATVTTSSDGQFQFPRLENGYYQLFAKRPGFAEARAGQAFKGGAGTPLLVEGDPFAVAELRLKRLGVVTGRTLDENRVGMARIPVSAYTLAIPRQILGTAVSDDLGVYRITGLPAGTYLIRTGAAEVEPNFHLLPVYHPFASASATDARPVTVDHDAEVRDIDLLPYPGRTASLGVRVTGCLGIAKLTLSSDQGRRQMEAPCNLDPVTFAGLTPGEYEVLAEGEAAGPAAGQQQQQADKQKLAAFTWVQVYSGVRTASLHLTPLPSLQVRMAGGGGPAASEAGIILRRRDLAGSHSETVAVNINPIQLSPGNWQISARPPGNAYLADVTFDQRGGRRAHLVVDPDWFEFYMGDGGLQATLSLSFSAARLSGRVKGSLKDVAGAPVHLLPLSPQTRRQMNGIRTVYAAQDGTYAFDGLAPGAYLVAASVEVTDVTEEALSGRAQQVTLEEGKTAALDLSLQ